MDEGGAPLEDEDISMNLNSLDEEEKEGLKSPFQQTGMYLFTLSIYH